MEDEEVIDNLELLMNMDALEQEDSWDELLTLTQLENDDPQLGGSK